MKRASILFAAVVLASCDAKVVEYPLNIVTTSCDAASDPFAGARYLQVRITGEGISPPIEAQTDAATRSLQLPEIPAGPGRVVQVRVYGQDGLSGKVLAWGQSLPFDVPDVVPEQKPAQINVFLRKVDAFTPLSAVTSPKQCAQMKVPRAGHTATLLKSGKVFIAGGYRLKEGTTEKIALADTELFNPQTGAFESARSISVSTQVLTTAYHTATLLPSDQVLIWGGEQYVGGALNTPAPRATALLYDPAADLFRAVPSRSTPKNIVRSHHSAALDKNGLVLIVGGLTRDDASQLGPANTLEWYNPSNAGTFVVDPALATGRIDGAVAAVQGGSLIAVAGGSDGGTTLRDVVYFGYDGTSFKQVGASGPQLNAARRGMGVATGKSGDDLLLFGGYSDPNYESLNPNPLATTEVVGTRNSTVADGPNAGTRGDSCVATLKDGSMLVIGGRTVDALGQPAKSDATVTVVKPQASGGYTSSIAPSLTNARFAHTCTTLADGSVLILGGVKKTSTTEEVLQDALIFTPAPAD